MDTITLASSLLSKVFKRTYLQSNTLIGFWGVETTWNWYTILFNSDEHKFDYNARNDRYTYSTAWVFHFHSQVHYLPVETCFHQPRSSAVEGTSQAGLGSSDQRKVPASLSLFLKGEKIPELLYVGKRPTLRLFSYAKIH
jgi:hypothetical protein